MEDIHTMVTIMLLSDDSPETLVAQKCAGFAFQPDSLDVAIRELSRRTL